MNELKPCPFCGREAKLIQGVGTYIFCSFCPAMMLANGTEPEQIIYAWNNRDTNELMKHYRQGLHDAELKRNGELMQAFDPD